MSDEMTAVTQDTGSATVETTSSPDTSSAATSTGTSTTTAAPTQAAPTGKTYTEADVQRIIRERVAGQNKRFSELEKQQKQYEAMIQRLNGGFEAFGKGLGFIKEEETPPWQKDIQTLREEYDKRFSEHSQRVEQAQLMKQIKSDFKVVQSKYPDWADMPGFKDEFARRWDPEKDPAEVMKDVVAAYEKKLAARSNAAAEAKAETAKVVPAGKGGGGTASATTGKKGSFGDRAKAAIRAAKA